MSLPNAIQEVLQMTLSVDLATRRAGESRIESDQKVAGFTVNLLLYIKDAHQPFQSGSRTAGAILFKNICKSRWSAEAGEPDCIPVEEKDTIRTHIVDLMCVSPPGVRRVLSDALSYISAKDFPDKWPSLLPSLVEKLSSMDYVIVNGVLDTANSIFKRFRDVQDNDEIRYPLKAALLGFQEPLLQLWKRTSGMVMEYASNESALLQLVPALRTMAAIFYSLTWIDLPEYFEDHLKEWMDEFHVYLGSYDNPIIRGDDDEFSEPGPIQTLQSALIRNVNLFSEKYDEEFAPYFGVFVQDIWGLLTKTKNIPKYDPVVCGSLKFLSNAIAQKMHVDLFSSDASLRTFLEGIAIPNLYMRESDIDVFESNPVEYLRKDIEGDIDSDSRLAGAITLIKKMCVNFNAQVLALGGHHINVLLQSYTENPKKWQAKDAAMKLVHSLSIVKYTRKQGVTETNPSVDPVAFFNVHVAPELLSNDLEEKPVLKAAALKYVTIFRNQLPQHALPEILQRLLVFMKANNEVLYTYACIAVEKILTLDGVSDKKALLAPILPNLFGCLFDIMERKGARENEHVMECLVRCVNVAQADVLPYIDTVLTKLTLRLGAVCANPANPIFNHNLFNVMAALVKNICTSNPAATGSFEGFLFPPFQHILQLDIAEFVPYVFQILAQLLEFHQSGVSPAYMSMFPALLTPSLWGRENNVEPLTRLLVAYLKADSNIIGPSNITGILGIFQKLIAGRKHQVHAFHLLNGVVLYVPREVWSPYFVTILQLLLQRMEKNKTVVYIRLLVVFMSTYVAKHGGEGFITTAESMQVGLSRMIITQIWTNNVLKLGGAAEKKGCALGLLNLLRLGSAIGDEVIVQVLVSLLMLLELPSEAPTADDHDDGGEVAIAPGLDDGDVYLGGFNKLSYARGPREVDHFKDVQDVKKSLLETLAGVSGRETILAKLPHDASGVLGSYCTTYGVRL